jgi:hypothetical protein
MSGLTARPASTTAARDPSRSEEPPEERRAEGRASTRRADLLVSTVIVLALAGPLLFTSSGFAPDFTNHLWLTWVAGRELAQLGHPGFFLNAPELGVFYPQFAFYGGTLYALTGGLGEALGGHPVLAYVLVSMVAFAACYTGTLWLGHELGLRGPIAHAPALAVVTSAYLITNLYGRGAWTEFVATAAIAPSIAAGVHLVRAPRWRPWPVLALAASVAIFSGSHNITLEWAIAIGSIDLIVLWLALGAPRRLPYRRLAMVAGLSLMGALINAWFLLPDIIYGKDTLIGTLPPPGGHVAPSFFDTLGVELYPFRHVPAQSTTPALYVQAPDWFLAWGLVAGALLLWRGPGTGRLVGAWIAASAAVTIDLILIVFAPIWHIIPFPLTEIQEPYRIGTYVFYAVAGLVLVSALALQRAAATGPRRVVRALRAGLVFVTVLSLGLCLWQEWVPNTATSYSVSKRGAALASVNMPPHSWYDVGVYRDARAPIVQAQNGRVLVIPPESVRNDRFAAWIEAPAGPEPIQTNIAGGDYVVHISGLERVGRSPAGYTVVRRPAGSIGPVHLVIEAEHNPATELGWILSLTAILGIMVVVILTGLRGRRAAPGAA